MKFTDKEVKEITNQVKKAFQLFPRGTNDFTIEYMGKREIRDKEHELYGHTDKVSAFYHQEKHIIYARTSRLTARILRREIGHHILCMNFIKGRMPAKMQERECQWVETKT